MCTRDLILKGSTALSVGDYDQAVGLFSQSLVGEASYDILVQKARALTELNNLTAALEDTQNAISLDATRPEAYLAQGIAHFKQGQVGSAQEDLQHALQKSSATLHAIVETWLRKVDAELNNKNFQSSTVKKIPKTEESVPKVVPTVPTSEVRATSGKIAYTWFQTAKTVGIEINHALANKADLKTHYEANRIEISFPIGNGSTYDLTLDLFAPIVPETVKTNTMLHKIEIILEKKEHELSWTTLNAQEVPDVVVPPTKIVEEPKPVVAASTTGTVVGPSGQPVNNTPKPLSAAQIQALSGAPAYPSSSLKKKNWDKIDMEIEEDIKKNKAEYGISDDPMKGIFKQIYDASDDDTKRAMMKSFQTSGGTVLSTNWNEVKDKDYAGKDRPEPPKGQEWRKWEK